MDFVWLLLQQVVNGVAVGSVYALVAIGLSLIWATGRLLDFAFGEIFMLGGVLAWTLMVSMGGGLTLSVLAVLPACFVIGAILQRTLYRRLSDQDHVIVLAATIGVSMILKDGATKIWGSETLIFPVLFNDVWFVGDIAIRVHFVFITLVALGLIALFHLVVARTRVGMAMRAVAENRSVAGMMGVNVQRMLAVAFGLSYLLAAAAGALIGPIHYVQTTGGTAMMIKGVTAAVLGGFGSLPGALIGGLLIGQVEALSAGFISSAFKDVIVFATFIVVLFIRPEGILGEKRQGVSAL
jgi:branched-chain amino acid transport system permease protein